MTTKTTGQQAQGSIPQADAKTQGTVVSQTSKKVEPVITQEPGKAAKKAAA